LWRRRRRRQRRVDLFCHFIYDPEVGEFYIQDDLSYRIARKIASDDYTAMETKTRRISLNYISKVAGELVRVSRLLVGFRVEMTPKTVKSARLEFLKRLRGIERAIKTEDDVEAQGKVLNGLLETVERFFYDWLLGKHMQRVTSGVSNEKLDPIASDLQGTAWEFVMGIRGHDLEIQLTPHWTLDPGEFEKVKKRLFESIKRKARAAFKDANEFVVYSSQAGETVELAEKVTVGKMTLVPVQGSESKQMARAVKDVKRAVGAIKSSGLGKVVQKPMVILVQRHGEGLVSAKYAPAKDIITLLGLASDGTVIHEFGHRYWYKILDSGRRNYWDRAFRGDLIEITKTDIDDVLDLAKRSRGENKLDQLRAGVKTYGRSGDPVRSHKANSFYRSIYRWYEKPDYWERTRKFWMDDYVGKPVMMNHVTDYGNTNAEEAFAEVFMLYVLGDSIVPTVEYWFEQII